MKKTAFAFLSLILLFACSTNSNIEEQIEEKPVLVKKIVRTFVSGEIITTNYSYDGRKILEIKDTGGNRVKYTYESDLLVRVQSYGENKLFADTTISYKSDIPSGYVVLYYKSTDPLPYLTHTHELIYNTDNTITDFIKELNSTSTIVLENGNVINEGGIIYAYDTKNGAFKNISSFKAFQLNVDFIGIYGKNNIIKEVLEEGIVNDEERYEYTYNDKDYPITSKNYFNGNLESTSQIFYE